uniref:cellular tumor antigen p53-like n=1 Tax=Pristiophorus japonicus TaxID=55135 RepID=UPI00398EBDF9
MAAVSSASDLSPPPFPPPPPPPHPAIREVSQSASAPDSSKRKLASEDEVFTLQVRSRERYELLKKINEALEIRELIPSSVIETYRQQQKQKHRLKAAHRKEMTKGKKLLLKEERDSD